MEYDIDTVSVNDTEMIRLWIDGQPVGIMDETTALLVGNALRDFACFRVTSGGRA